MRVWLASRRTRSIFERTGSRAIIAEVHAAGIIGGAKGKYSGIANTVMVGSRQLRTPRTRRARGTAIRASARAYVKNHDDVGA
jgi:hypothetical protein